MSYIMRSREIMWDVKLWDSVIDNVRRNYIMRYWEDVCVDTF